MTDELLRAYLEGEPPFGGQTCSVDGLNHEELWRSYRAAALCLPVSEPLWQCADWHWHDGFVTPRQPLPSSEFLAWLESPVLFFEAWKAEDYVHRAVYPDDLSWYLRFYLWEDPAQGDCGLDFSGPDSLVESVRAATGGMVRPAVEWFSERGHSGF